MEKKKKLTAKKVIIILAAIFIVCGGAIFGMPYVLEAVQNANKVASTEEYEFTNPEGEKAVPDEGFKIDGVFDEEEYQDNKWLYLENTEGGADCNIAITSHFGEKGMYFAYDVDERTPINVNPDRSSYLNSCIEMYLSPSYLTSLSGNSAFEIDMLPNEQIVFKKTNGKGGWADIKGAAEIMPYVGATTKGGALNTEECNGYTLELYIPWAYMEKWGIDVEEVKKTHVYVNPAHITSFNYTGDDTNVDRYHYWFAQQIGGSWGDVGTHFRFDKDGVQGTTENEFVQGDNYTISGPARAIVGMKGTYKVTPKEGYAITSFVINGKEYIKDANFLEDGSVVWTTRQKAGGLKITAKAEAVTGGKKTLTGTLSSSKLGDTDLSTAKLTYKGSKGVKPIKFDANGKFTVANLEPGYYTITAEKNGYKKTTRTVYVNRDMDINVVLNYDVFEVVMGNAWILDEQSNDLLMRLGGGGGSAILTKDAYSNVSIEATFKYDKEVTKKSDADPFQQQRQGIRALFSNGKVFHVDILKETDKKTGQVTWMMQYAAFSGKDSLFSWKKVYELTPAQVAKYQSSGLKFELQRSGRLINLLLDGKVVANEYLDAEYANLTARVGFESWAASSTITEIPYKISQKKISASSIFKATQGFDFSKSNNGVFTINNESDGKEDDTLEAGTLLDTYRSISMKIKDAKNDGKFSFVYIFRFANGEVLPIRLMNLNNAKGERQQTVQLMDAYGNTLSRNDGKDGKGKGGWTTIANLSAGQVSKLTSEGIEFGVSIIGETAYVYLDGIQVGTYDISKNKDREPSKVKNETATICIRMYGNGDVPIEVPFTISGAALAIKSSLYGTVTPSKKNVAAGETIVLTAKNDDGTPAKQIKIDGKVYNLDANGQISLKVQAAGHQIQGIYKKSEIFEASGSWDTTKEYDGKISTVSAGNGQFVYTAASDYRQVTVKAKDLTKKGDFSIIVTFKFTNGKSYAARITTNGTAMVQQFGDKDRSNITDGKWATFTNLSATQVSKLQSEGLEFTMGLVGEKMYLLVDGKQAGTVDLSKGADGKPTNIATAPAAIGIRLDGNVGVQTDVEFDLKKIAIVNPKSELGVITTDKEEYAAGETVVVTATNKDGSPCADLYVDGKLVALTAGKYSFKAEKKGHIIEGNFRGDYFIENGSWNLSRQDEGVISVPGAEFNAWVETKKDTYRGFSIVVKDFDMNTRGFNAMTRFNFTNGESFVIRLNNDNDDAKAVTVQVMQEGTIGKWGNVGNPLPQDIKEKLWTEGIEYAVYIVGEQAQVYIEGQYWGSYDLSTNRAGKPTNVANETAKIRIRIDRNQGKVNEVKFALAESNLNIKNDENGTVTADKKNYLLGDKAVVKVVSNEGVYCEAIEVDGKQVLLDGNGTATFEVTKHEHTIVPIYVDAIFKPNAEWNVQEQLKDKVSVPSTTDGYTGWLQTLYTYTGVEVTAKYHTNRSDLDGSNKLKNPYGFALGLVFENGKTVSIRLTNADSDGSVFKLQSVGDSIFKWKNHYTLTADEVSKLKGDGIKYKIIRDSADATKLDIYLDDKLVVDNLDLTGNNSGVTTDMNTTARMALYENMGVETEVPFKLLGGKAKVTLDIKAAENGKVEGAKRVYRVDDDVVLEVKANAGYACKTLKVDGKEVDLAANGTYTFKATKETYTVEATFAKAIFQNNGNYNTNSQLFGAVALTNAASGTAGYIKTEADTYRDVTVTAKRVVAADYCMITVFEFTNNEKFVVRLNVQGSGYTIQIIPTDSQTFVRPPKTNSDKDAGEWKNLYTLKAVEAAKLNGEGLDYRVAIIDEKAVFFLDGIKVTEFDLSKNYKKEATNLADVTARIAIRMDGNKQTEVGIPFKLGAEPKKVTAPTIVAPTNGTLKLDSDVYYEGQKAVVECKAADGYAIKTWQVDGKDVEPNYEGKYAFAITKDDHKVEATFVEPIWTSTSTEWDMFGQFKGNLVVTKADNADKATEDAIAKGNYSQVSTTVKYTDGMKDADGNFAVTMTYKFANNKLVTVQLKLDKDGKFTLTTSGSGLAPNARKNVVLDAAYATKMAKEGITLKMVRDGLNFTYYIDGTQVLNVKTMPTFVPVTNAVAEIQLNTNIAIGKTLELKCTLQ